MHSYIGCMGMCLLECVADAGLGCMGACPPDGVV